MDNSFIAKKSKSTPHRIQNPWNLHGIIQKDQNHELFGQSIHWLYPPIRMQSRHHQDWYISSRESLPKPWFATGILGPGGVRSKVPTNTLITTLPYQQKLNSWKNLISSWPSQPTRLFNVENLCQMNPSLAAVWVPEVSNWVQKFWAMAKHHFSGYIHFNGTNGAHGSNDHNLSDKW